MNDVTINYVKLIQYSVNQNFNKSYTTNDIIKLIISIVNDKYQKNKTTDLILRYLNDMKLNTRIDFILDIKIFEENE